MVRHQETDGWSAEPGSSRFVAPCEALGKNHEHFDLLPAEATLGPDHDEEIARTGD